MTLFIIFCVLVSATVGIRFQVYVLVPLTVAAVAGVTVIAIARGDQIWATFLTALLSAASVQVGYLCGSCVSFLQGSSRTDERAVSRSAPAPTSSQKTA